MLRRAQQMKGERQRCDHEKEKLNKNERKLFPPKPHDSWWKAKKDGEKKDHLWASVPRREEITGMLFYLL